MGLDRLKLAGADELARADELDGAELTMAELDRIELDGIKVDRAELAGRDELAETALLETETELTVDVT